MFRFLVFFVFFALILGECPQNSINLEDDPSICYSFHATNTKFALAQLHCHSFGANLVAFQSDYANVFVSQIASILFNESESGYYWSGGHRLHDDSTFEWINGEEFNYTNFIHGQEEKKRGGCVSIQLEKGSWKTEDCFEEFPFVCQFDANQSITPSNAVFIEENHTPNIPDSFFTTIPPTTMIVEKDKNETDNTITSHQTTLKSILITTTLTDFATVTVTPMSIPTTTTTQTTTPTMTSTTTTTFPPKTQTTVKPTTSNTKFSSPSTPTSPIPTTTTQSKTDPTTKATIITLKVSPLTTILTTTTTPKNATTALTSPSSKVQSVKPPTTSTTIKILSSTTTSPKVVLTNPTTTEPPPKIISTTLKATTTATSTTLKIISSMTPKITTTTKAATTTTQKSTTTATIKPLKSLTGWVNYNDTGFSYNFYDEWESFKAAEVACQNQGAHLVSIHSKDENIFVYHMVKKFYKQSWHGPDFSVWLGYLKKDQNTFWTDKSVYNYSTWSEEVHGSIKHCGAMWATYSFFNDGNLYTGQWTDRPCEENKRFVCKKAAAS